MANPTIGATTPRIQYTATGGQTAFTVPFEFLANADLAVYVNGTLQTLTTHYTLTGANTTGGGTCTFVSGRTVGDIVTIIGNLAYSRSTNKYTKFGLLPAEVLEADFDALQVQAKQLARDGQFALRAPLTDTGSPAMTLPVVATRASKALGFDASGNPTVSASTLADIDSTVQIIDTLNALPAGASSSISYQPAGVGAVTTTVQAKLRETVSVKDFGAVGDGVTDDTAAIQAALNTGYAEVYFPSGKYKTTATLYIKMTQTIRGTAVALQPDVASAHHSTIMFRPTGADKVAIKNTVSTYGNSIRDMALDLNDASHYGVQFSTTYGNVIEGMLFFGTFDIGIIIQDAYVCDINRVTISGCTVKRFGIYIGASNSIKISRLHTSIQVQDAATCMYGLAIYGGGREYTIADCLFQGTTIGIALHNSGVISTNIFNAYFENCVCNLRAGSPASAGGPIGINIIGGAWGGPYAYHPQYASRGPIIWLRYGSRFNIKGARFDQVPAPATSTGPWSILCAIGQSGVNVEACSIFGSSTMKDLVMRETSGASPLVTIVGDTYGAYGGTEIVLKKDGAYGGTSYGIRVDTAGAVTTSAYAPTQITGAPAALLSSELPAPASLLL